MTPLEESYRECQRQARRAASNFYYAFWLLPAAKRRAMCALYAFFRRADDLCDSDEPLEVRQVQLRRWRASLERAIQGEFCDPLMPALADTARRYRVPTEYLFDSLAGVEMDLEPRRYETFEELRQYCYRVASVVGLSCIHVWGYRGREAIPPAVACGVAFQLTNILRDLPEDARRGRLYLPREDLRRFNYHEEQLRRGERNSHFYALMQFEIDRAEQLYQQAAGLEECLSPEGRRCFRLMRATYYALLEEIKRRRGDVFSRRVRLSRWKKLGLLAREGVVGMRSAECGAGSAKRRMRN